MLKSRAPSIWKQEIAKINLLSCWSADILLTLLFWSVDGQMMFK